MSTFYDVLDHLNSYLTNSLTFSSLLTSEQTLHFDRSNTASREFLQHIALDDPTFYKKRGVNKIK